MLEVCTQTEYFQKLYGDEGALVKLKECGFEAVDFCLAHQRLDEFPADLPDEEYDEYFRKLGEFARKIGMKIYQTHLPFPCMVGDGKDEARFLLQQKCVRATGLLGAKYAVGHPPLLGDCRYSRNAEENKAATLQFSEKILPLLKQFNVTLCWENIFTFDNGRICPSKVGTPPMICEMLDELDPDYFAACADVGHALLTGYDPAETIRLFGKRLKTVHLHDNDGVKDLHLSPYTGILRWTEIAAALADVGFSGGLSLEADHTYEWWKVLGEDPHLTGQLLVRSVQKLRKEIQEIQGTKNNRTEATK